MGHLCCDRRDRDRSIDRLFQFAGQSVDHARRGRYYGAALFPDRRRRAVLSEHRIDDTVPIYEKGVRRRRDQALRPVQGDPGRRNHRLSGLFFQSDFRGANGVSFA